MKRKSNRIHSSNVWHLVKDNIRVCFIWDQGVMLINYQTTKETYTKTKEEARKDWKYLVQQGYVPEDQFKGTPNKKPVQTVQGKKGLLQKRDLENYGYEKLREDWAKDYIKEIKKDAYNDALNAYKNEYKDWSEPQSHGDC